MDMNGWVLSFLIIFMLHNLEEIIMIEKWFQKTYPNVMRRIPSFAQEEIEKYKDITSAQFSVVVFVFSVFTSVLIMIAVMTPYYYLFLGVNFFFAVNIFTHPLQVLYVRRYTPGLLTSLVLIIPYYRLFFSRLYHTNLLTSESIIGAIVVMIFLILVLFLSHTIGEKWARL